jgi:Fungal fucose-specific lectin
MALALLGGAAPAAPAAVADGWAQGGALTSSVASGTSPVGFAFGSGEARIYFVAAADGQIHELGYHSGSGWLQSSALTSIGVASGTRPTGFQYGTGGAVRVYFVAAADGAIHELSFNPSGGWAVSGPMTPAVRAGTSPTGFEFGPDGAARVYYVQADDGEIHELGYNPSGGWSVSAALTSPVAPATSPVGFDFGGGAARIYFVAAADGQVHELGYDPSTGWVQSAALTSTGVAAGSTPVAFPYAGAGAGAVRLYYVSAADGAIHELGDNPGSGWAVSSPLTEAVAAGTSPIGYPLGDGVRVYFVARSDGELHQLAYNSSTLWSQSVGMSAPLAAGTSPTGFPFGDCDQRIYFAAASDGEIHELSYNGPDQTECLGDLEPVATDAPVGTAPVNLTPRRRLGHVHAKITMSWRWQGLHTTLRRITFLRLSRRASVRVTCGGRGCPRRRWSSRPGRSARLARALRGQVFRAGDRVLVTFSVPHEVSLRARVTIRRSRRPLARVL